MKVLESLSILHIHCKKSKKDGEKIPKSTAMLSSSSSSTTGEHWFAQVLLLQWYKQGVKYSLRLPYLKLGDGFSSAWSPEGCSDALGPGTTNERPLRAVGSQQHQQEEG